MNKKKPVKTNVKLSTGGKPKPSIQKAASKARRSASKKSGFNPAPFIFIAIVAVGGFFAYKPIMKFIEESNRPKVVEVVKKEAPKKKKKVIKKEAPKVVKKLEVPKFEKPKENLFKGEINHYTFSSVVKDRCFACHGEEGKEVEGKFDFVKFLASGKTNPKAWTIIYNEISKGNMPPEDEEPLNEDEKEVLLSEIKKLTATDTVVRNTRALTPNEIKNTVSDLFQVDSKVYDPFPRLFQNYTNDKFYTCQENVLTPYYLEDLYTSLNDAISSYVSLDSRTDPIKMKVDFPTQVHRVFSKGSNFDLRWTHSNFLNEIHFTKYEDKDAKKKKPRRETGPETKTDQILEKLTLPPGTYELSFRAQSQNMDPDKYPKKFGKEVVSLYKNILSGLDYGLPVDFYIAPPGQADAFAKSQLITTFNIDSSQMTEYKLKFTLSRRSAIAYRYPIKMPYDGAVATMLASHMLGNGERKNQEEMLKKYMRVPNYKFAQIRFKDLKIRGPFNVKVNDYSFRDDERVNDTSVRKKFKSLHEDASLKNNTVYSYIFSKLKQSKLDSEESYKTAMISFFLSPDFLTVNNNKKEKQSYARYVSYAFHKSHPSNEFSEQLAAAQRARKADKLTDWLVKHENFQRFTDSFTYQWLKMADIKDALPEEKKYGLFHVKNFFEAYKLEASLFLKHLFEKDLSVTEMITADYSFVNDDLKDFYQGGNSGGYYGRIKYEDIEPVEPREFKMHKFTDGKRGGLLTLGAFLTATGNGVDPLPIKRSTWILENLLDSHLPPPPEDLDLASFESAEHSNNLKKKLESHSSNPACYSCHKRIDPLAIVMDYYDTMGGRNNRFSRESVMINGTKISDIAELKKYLGTQDEILARSFTKKLLQFTLGRDLYVQDEPKINRIIEENKESGYKVKGLMNSVIRYFFL